MNTESSDQRLESLGDAALLLDVPRRWLRGEAEAGRVPCLKAGTRLLFNVALVRQLLLKRASGRGGDS